MGTQRSLPGTTIRALPRDALTTGCELAGSGLTRGGRIPALEREGWAPVRRHAASRHRVNLEREIAVSRAPCPTGPVRAAISPVKALDAGMRHNFRTAVLPVKPTASPVKPTAASAAQGLAARREAIRLRAHLGDSVERHTAFRPRARSAAGSAVAATRVASVAAVTSAAEVAVTPVGAATAAGDNGPDGRETRYRSTSSQLAGLAGVAGRGP